MNIAPPYHMVVDESGTPHLAEANACGFALAVAAIPALNQEAVLRQLPRRGDGSYMKASDADAGDALLASALKALFGVTGFGASVVSIDPANPANVEAIERAEQAFAPHMPSGQRFPRGALVRGLAVQFALARCLALPIFGAPLSFINVTLDAVAEPEELRRVFRESSMSANEICGVAIADMSWKHVWEEPLLFAADLVAGACRRSLVANAPCCRAALHEAEDRGNLVYNAGFKSIDPASFARGYDDKR